MSAAPSRTVARAAAISGAARYVCGAAAVCLALALSGAAWAGPAVVITDPQHNDKPLDRATVRAIFSGRLRQWPDGQPIRAYVLPDNSPLHVQFCREVLGTYPYLLRGSWDRLVFTGTGVAPEVVRSESEMRQKVERTPGAIGYASAPEPASPPLARDPRATDAGVGRR